MKVSLIILLGVTNTNAPLSKNKYSNSGQLEMKGTTLKKPGNLKQTCCLLSLLVVALAAIGISCAGPHSAGISSAQALGDVGARLENYTQTNGVGWSAMILLTNRSTAKLECFAISYAAGLTLGSMSGQAKDLKSDRLPKALVWTKRAPEMHMDPSMMRRYGMGRVFELDPGEHIRLALPIYVPQAHPQEFVEHFAVGFRRTGTREYETYVAELRQQ